MGGPRPSKKGRSLHSRRGDPGSADACDLYFSVALVGVRREVSETLRPGDVLDVALERADQHLSAICKTIDGGRPAGALAAFPGLVDLIECLQAGVRYEAVVQDASATRCAVFVFRSGP